MDNNNPDVKSPDLYECRKFFGVRLKELREKQGLTLAEVGERTRVNSEFIAAIEAGDFSRLPGRLFARGFVAAVLKLYNHTDGVLASEFEALWVDDGIRESISQSTKMRLAGKKHRFLGRGHSAGSIVRLTAAAMALLLVGAVFVGALWFGYGKGRSYLARLNKANNEAVPVQLQLNPASADNAAEATPQQSSEVKAAADEEQTAMSNAVDGAQVIAINVVEPVKIKIESDGQRAITKDFDVGSYTFTFKDASDLLIYDAGAVRISFNGNSIGPVGAKGRIRKIGFRANGPDKGAF